MSSDPVDVVGTDFFLVLSSHCPFLNYCCTADLVHFLHRLRIPRFGYMPFHMTSLIPQSRITLAAAQVRVRSREHSGSLCSA